MDRHIHSLFLVLLVILLWSKPSTVSHCRSKCTGQPSDFSLSQVNMSLCHCENGEQVCRGDRDNTGATYVMATASTAQLYDISNFTHSPTDYLLTTFSDFIFTRQGGWSLTNDSGVNVWFNNKAWHSMPAFYNAYSNALLRSIVNSSSTSEATPSSYGNSHLIYSHLFFYKSFVEDFSRSQLTNIFYQVSVPTIIL